MKLNSGLFLLISAVLCFENNVYSQRDIPKDDKTYTMEISSTNFSESITIARNNPEKRKVFSHLWYYWYMNNTVHFSEGGYSGKLLNGEYKSYYKNMNLRSSGNFRYGLMHDEWKTWYENGLMKSAEQWKKGIKHGSCEYFSENGMIRTMEKYRRGILEGKRMVYKNDSLVEVRRFKNGEEVLKKLKNQIDVSEDSLNKTKEHKAVRNPEAGNIDKEKAVSTKDQNKLESGAKTADENADRKNRIRLWPFNLKKVN